MLVSLGTIDQKHFWLAPRLLPLTGWPFCRPAPQPLQRCLEWHDPRTLYASRTMAYIWRLSQLSSSPVTGCCFVLSGVGCLSHGMATIRRASDRSKGSCAWDAPSSQLPKPTHLWSPSQIDHLSHTRSCIEQVKNHGCCPWLAHTSSTWTRSMSAATQRSIPC